MIKEKVKTEEKSTSLMMLAPGGVDLKDRVAKQQKPDFLPYIFMSTKKTPGVPEYHMILKDGTEIVLSSVFFLVHIISRLFCRQLVGSKYENRCYSPLSEDQPGKTGTRVCGQAVAHRRKGNGVLRPS